MLRSDDEREEALIQAQLGSCSTEEERRLLRACGGRGAGGGQGGAGGAGIRLGKLQRINAQEAAAATARAAAGIKSGTEGALAVETAGGSLFAAPAAPVRRAKPTASPRKKKRKRDSASKKSSKLKKRSKNKQKCEASTENVSNKAKRVPKKACVRAGEVKKKKKKKKKKKSNNK